MNPTPLSHPSIRITYYLIHNIFVCITNFSICNTHKCIMDYSIRNYMRVVWHGGSWVIVIHMVMVDGDIAVGLVWCGVYGGGF